MNEGIAFLDALLLDVVGGVEALHFTSDTHWVVTGIKVSDLINPSFSRSDGCPGGGYIESTRTDGADSGYDNSTHGLFFRSRFRGSPRGEVI